MRRIILVLLAACGGETKLSIAPPWPEDHPAALMIAGEGLPISDLQLVFERAPVRLEIAEGRSARVIAMAWAPPPLGPDLAPGCRLEIDSGPDALPPPALAWTSTPIGEGELAWSTGAQAISMKAICPPRNFDCPGITAEHIDVGATALGLVRVVALSATVAIAGGTHVTPEDMTALIVRIEAGGPALHTTLEEVKTEIQGIGFDGRRVIGATYRGDLFELDTLARGRRIGSAGGNVNHLFAHRSGLTLIQRVSPVSPQNVELDPLTNELALRPDFPESVRQSAIASPDLIFASTGGGVIHRGVGSRWTRELVRDADPEFTAMTATPDAVFATLRYGPTLWRDATAQWREIGRPLAGFPLGVRSLSRGRAVVITEQGEIGLWDGVRWCGVASGTRQPLKGVDVAPDGETVWIVGLQEEPGRSAPNVIRFVAP